MCDLHSTLNKKHQAKTRESVAIELCCKVDGDSFAFINALTDIEEKGSKWSLIWIYTTSSDSGQMK